VYALGDEVAGMRAASKTPKRATRNKDETEQALIGRWLEPDALRPAEMRVVEHGIELWALIGYARGLDGTEQEVAERVAQAYDLPVDAVRAALAYYRRHPLQIDARLEANEAAHAG
jgi:uncharacterized protein (DUF433 family)